MNITRKILRSMTKIKEHIIGERFEVDHIIYEVRPSHLCKRCSLWVENERRCLDLLKRFEHCSGEYRTDGQDVIFVQVDAYATSL